jgi:hypothetical protein
VCIYKSAGVYRTFQLLPGVVLQVEHPGIVEEL